LTSDTFRAIDMQGYIYYQQISIVNLYKIIILTCFKYWN